jgi:predicted oxidoreductase
LKGYAAAARGEAVSLDAQMPVELEPLVEPPFHALEVQPAITFTYGGLRTAPDGRVLDHDGVRVNGLWAAGVDVGGRSGSSVHHRPEGGGLRARRDEAGPGVPSIIAGR